jgi:glutathionyl-hydroquinone reductase
VAVHPLTKVNSLKQYIKDSKKGTYMEFISNTIYTCGVPSMEEEYKKAEQAVINYYNLLNYIDRAYSNHNYISGPILPGVVYTLQDTPYEPQQ